MSEELEPKEETTETPKKVKKGFSLSQSTITMLTAKADATGYRQSAIVNSVLDFGIPAFGEKGMADLKIVTLEEFQILTTETLAAEMESRTDPDPAIPFPEPVPTKRGRRPKLKIPGQQLVDIPQQQQEIERSHPQEEQGLYRPNMAPAPGPAEEPGTHTPMTGNERLVSLEANMNLLMQMMMQQQVVQPPPAPVDMNPYNQIDVPPPQPVFAASYPPGYTGPPGVSVPQPQAQPAPMYPQPGSQPQQRQDLQDPYAMNIGASPGNQGQGGLTAQGILSGNQPMTPNVGGGNVNMDIANKALGNNWRGSWRQRQAAGMRE